MWGLDRDSDGLSDLGERALGTNPDDLDTDGDGIDDFTETDGGLPTDTDGDGIIDALDPDSDGDGLPDDIDPFRLDPDSDGDGIPDGSDPDSLAAAVRALDPGVFSNRGDPMGQRNAILSILRDIQEDINNGDIDQAIRALRNLLRRVDGCVSPVGTSPQHDDWITNCEAQLEIRRLINVLVTNLGG